MRSKIIYKEGQDINGTMFLRELEAIVVGGQKKRMGEFRCKKCGSLFKNPISQVKSGNTNTCGCGVMGGKRDYHGMTNKSEYSIWKGMKNRCYIISNKYYKNYGGRGIAVCDKWKNSFENFYNDMGPRPTDNHSLERINVNGNYEPSNCRWATRGEQDRNKTCSRLVTYMGVTKTYMTWLHECGFTEKSDYHRIKNRLLYGWPIDKAFDYKIK